MITWHWFYGFYSKYEWFPDLLSTEWILRGFPVPSDRLHVKNSQRSRKESHIKIHQEFDPTFSSQVEVCIHMYPMVSPSPALTMLPSGHLCREPPSGARSWPRKLQRVHWRTTAQAEVNMTSKLEMVENCLSMFISSFSIFQTIRST